MVFLQPVRTDLRAHWQRLMVVGCSFLLAAELAFFCALLSSAPASANVLGIVVMVAGVLGFHAVACRTGWPGRRLQDIAACVHLLAGAGLALGPPSAVPALACVLALGMLAGGLLCFVRAWTQRDLHWKWAVLSACASVILGARLMLELPAFDVAALATIVGAQYVLDGVTWSGYAWLGWRNHQYDYLLPRIRRPPRISGY